MGDTVIITSELYGCVECGALVLPEFKQQHLRWHDAWDRKFQQLDDRVRWLEDREAVR